MRQAERRTNQEVARAQDRFKRLSSILAVASIIGSGKTQQDDEDETEDYGTMKKDRHKGAYEWHPVLNHASRRVLTKMAHTPYVSDKYMDSIVVEQGTTCRPCLEAKSKRAPHDQRRNNYTQGKAFCSDILGLVRMVTLNPSLKRP